MPHDCTAQAIPGHSAQSASSLLLLKSKQAITKRTGSSKWSPSVTREGQASTHKLEEGFTELVGNSVEAGRAQQDGSRTCVRETVLTPVDALSFRVSVPWTGERSVVYCAAQGSPCLFIRKKEFRLLVKTPALTALWHNT